MLGENCWKVQRLLMFPRFLETSFFEVLNMDGSNKVSKDNLRFSQVFGEKFLLNVQSIISTHF